MNKWGPYNNEDFIVDTLTGDYADNNNFANILQSDTFVLYIDYLKGSESNIKILVEYSSTNDSSPDVWFTDTLINLASRELVNCEWQVTSTGKYRLAIPVVAQEDKIRISVKGEGVAPFTGTLTLTFATGNYNR